MSRQCDIVQSPFLLWGVSASNRRRPDYELEGCRGAALSAIVVTACGDAHFAARELVDESVLIGDTSRPISGEIVLERFGLADSFIAVAHYILNQGVDAPENPPILRLPPEIVLPGVAVPNDEHH
jgi:hypothetical protein